jgi:hypothetical protein
MAKKIALLVHNKACLRGLNPRIDCYYKAMEYISALPNKWLRIIVNNNPSGACALWSQVEGGVKR